MGGEPTYQDHGQDPRGDEPGDRGLKPRAWKGRRRRGGEGRREEPARTALGGLAEEMPPEGSSNMLRIN